ncbi:hypothetical protein GGD81_000166 [Rhodobium orientis]|nr:DUF1176 domain-containing protein [Rhodobium orientis]MBB4301151.1 hypothetical protein [Rhodobium orientis]
MAKTHLAAAIAALILTAGSPAGAEESTFDDWSAVCEEEDGCIASSLVGKASGGYDARFALRVGRTAKADSAWTISISTIAVLADRDRPAEVRVDDNPPLTLKPERGYAPFGTVNDFFIVDDGTLNILIGQMLAGESLRFTFLDVSGTPHDVDFPLAGVADALLWIDEAQGRLGSPLLAGPPNHLSPAPKIDNAAAIARLGVPPHLLARHRAASTCEDPNSEHMSGFDPVIGAVSKTATLYALPCTAGGNNVGYRLYIVETGEIGGIEPLYFAAFNGDYGWVGTDTLFNIAFNEETKELTSAYKARGAGDCGHSGTWVWKNYAFAMREFSAPNRCNGSGGPGGWPKVYPAK